MVQQHIQHGCQSIRAYVSHKIFQLSRAFTKNSAHGYRKLLTPTEIEREREKKHGERNSIHIWSIRYV